MADLFKDVIYYPHGKENDELKQLLKVGGGRREFHLSPLVTHIIVSSASAATDDWEDLEASIVTEKWVLASVAAGVLLPCQPFSIGDSHLFSRVTACPSQMSPEDRLHLWAMLTYHGGQMKLHLDTSCTHLLVPSANGAKYKRASNTSEEIAIVSPDWVPDSIKNGRLLPIADYALSPAYTDGTNDSQLTCEPSMPAQHLTGKVDLKQVPLVQVTRCTSPPFASVATGKPTVNPYSDINLLPSDPVVAVPEDSASQNSAPFLDPRFAMPSTARPTKTILTRHQASNVVADSPMRDTSPASSVSIATGSSVAASRGDASLGPMPMAEPIRGDQAAVAEASAPVAGKSSHALVAGSEVPDKVLSGAVFVFTDYQESMDPTTLAHWKEIVERNGGKVVSRYSAQCTHVLAMNQLGAVCKEALQDSKKVVAAHWLNDVLDCGKVFLPSLVLHFPTAFRDSIPGCSKLVVTLSGYTTPQRLVVRDMIQLSGAMYTNTLSRQNTHVICKKPEGAKYSRANDWCIPVVNGRWLSDLIMCVKIPDVSLAKYKEFGREDELNARSHYSKALLASWMPKKELKVMMVRAKSLSSPVSTVEPPTKRVKHSTPRVMFTALPVALTKQLKQAVVKLGGEVVTDVTVCTHLVAQRVARTIKFMAAMSVAKFILNPTWLQDSAKEGRFLDEGNYMLHDVDGENQMDFCLSVSLRRRSVRTRPLLHGLTVYCSPNVEPPVSGMRTVVECAGGQLLDTVPSDEKIKGMKMPVLHDRPQLVVVTSVQDVKICRPFMQHNIGIYTTELILEGVLTQEIDFSRNYLIT